MPATEPVRVLFDATRLLARGGLATPTGIDRVDFAYVAALGAAPDVDLRLMVFDLFGPRLLGRVAGERLVTEINTRWQAPRPANEALPAWRRLRAWLAAPPGTAAPRPDAAAPDPKPSRLSDAASLLRPGFGLRRLAAQDGPCVYVNTSHGRLFRKQVSQFLESAGIPGVFFIHDLIPIEHPEFHRARESGRHPARLETVSAHAACVIVNSEATKVALLKYLSEHRLRIPPVEVLHLGIDARFGREGATPPAATAPYFVTLGTIEPRKNHLLLLQVWQRLAASQGAAAPRLVLLGRRGWENERVFGLLDRSPPLAAGVAECPDLGDAQVVSLLRGARALLAPSYAEGFGLPVAEALAMGTPVLASDIPAHREVGGACAEYLDPLDGPGWARAVADYAVESSPRRRTQLARLTQHRAPRWEQHLGAALELIRDAARARMPRVQRTLSPTSH